MIGLPALLRRLDVSVPSSGETKLGARTYGMVGALSLVVLFGAAVFANLADIPGGTLTREPQVTLGGKFYTGALSNLGALIWMFAATMAFVGWVSSTSRSAKTMFFHGMLATLALLIDDFFLIHDVVESNQDFHLDRVLLLSYFLAALYVVVRHRSEMGVVPAIGILLGLGMFALSGVLDTQLNSLDQLFEDGAKFVGICFYAAGWTICLKPWSLQRES